VIRRYVYDSKLGAVVELGQHVQIVTDPGDRFKEAKEQHKLEQSESAGKQLREAALDIADRRVWAHNRRGDERRWRG
jgi:hypothetical protein